MSFCLPTELFQHILTYVDDPDVANLRLVCRSFDSKCFFVFGARCFREKQFMLSSDGLQALCGVANGRFGPFMRILRIGSEALVCCEDATRNRHHRTLHALCESQKSFRLRGLDTALLAVALRALNTTLTEIVVAGSGSSTEKRSWGARKLERETGTALIHEQNRALSTTLSAIAVSQIRLFAFSNEPLDGRSGIGAHHDSIATPCPLPVLLSSSFSSLRRLQLSLWAPGTLVECEGADLTTSLVRLLSTTPHLEQLHLGLQRVIQTPRLGEEFGRGRFSTALKFVRITGGWVDEGHVYSFLMNHQESLRKVTLNETILSGGWHRLVQRLEEMACSYRGKGLRIRLEDVADMASMQIITASRQICSLHISE